ncbi:uncharacterized protein B0P05DRAFT_77265 [Gilbertella persicaria]|uniref:uncharacterized protein n=1 Tax=Gilbertella persicaria TaxID=101096 RepID=UPI00221E4D89|nr:uncharacterized protein B0P05DRAFT_77265 [Gilbertella persicaria]KAI8080114.1 hypothetical protein B0P05DRAFT_77265 [Gilbertella persicaria]
MSLELDKIELFHQRLTPAHISLCASTSHLTKGKWIHVAERQSRDRGHHCVADTTLQQGDLLITEEPFIRQLDHQLVSSHCHYCFRDMRLLDEEWHMCRDEDCLWVIQYCSEKCEQLGWSSMHQWLCRIPELQCEDPDALFAFQGFLACRAKGQATLPGLESNLKRHNPAQLEEYQAKFRSMASLFYLSLSEVQCLVEILCQIRCNTFAVKTAKSNAIDSDRVVSRECVTLGRAIYLSASKLNHDCDPNALASFGNRYENPCQLKVRCIKSQLKPGQEVTISYGPLASVHERKERQKKLKNQYFFDCECQACQSGDSTQTIYKCQLCKTGKMYRQQSNCPECDQKHNWSHVLRTESEIEMFKKQSDYLKVLQLQSNIYHHHTLPIGDTMDKLAQLYCMQGQMKPASDYSKKSLEIIQHIYGKISIEAAEEMMKLSTLLLNACVTGHRNLRQPTITHIKQTMITYRLLGLDKSIPEDMEELEEMINHLFIMAP